MLKKGPSGMVGVDGPPVIAKVGGCGGGSAAVDVEDPSTARVGAGCVGCGGGLADSSGVPMVEPAMGGGVDEAAADSFANGGADGGGGAVEAWGGANTPETFFALFGGIDGLEMEGDSKGD